VVSLCRYPQPGEDPESGLSSSEGELIAIGGDFIAEELKSIKA
jgi:hypothetical protein